MARRIVVCLVLGLCGALGMKAQPAAPSIEAYFTGKTVVAKIDMPGTEKGVDLDFEKTTPLDWKKYNSRLTSFGVAIHKGDTVQVTKIALKKDHVEFQLNGGGYGTFGESTDTNVSTKDVDKSAYEKDLEKQLKSMKEGREREEVQRNLDREVARRERAQSEARAVADAARQRKEAELAIKRARGGSRFNLNFKGSFPDDDKNPDAVMKLLADYVDFAPGSQTPGPQPVDAVGTPERQPLPGGAGGSATGQLQRGMKLIDVSNLLGKGSVTSQSTSSEGLQTQAIEFQTTESVVNATFVEGVMVKYTVSSKPAN